MDKKIEASKIQKRISEIKKELELDVEKLKQVQQFINNQSQQILAKKGALLELQKLLKVPEKTKETKEKK